MTDTTSQLEPAGFCTGCGTLVAARLADTHKRQGCTARLANTFRQYRQTHDGAHVTLDQTADSFDHDIDAIIARLKTLEASSSSAGQAGITVTADLDADLDLDDLDTGTQPEPRHPLTDAQPRINPVTGLPE